MDSAQSSRELPVNTLDDRSGQQSVIEMYRRYDADRYAAWESYLQASVTEPELSSKDAAVITVSLDSVAHMALPTIERHVDEALDAGSCVIELIEAVMHLGSLESGGHGLHDGLEAVEMVIRARRATGRPVVIEGPQLAPHDMVPEAAWPVPPVFPYHSPYPRYHYQVIAQYHAELWSAFKGWREAQFRLRKVLTRRMQELLVTACDAGIHWPEPLLDHHMHAAFEVGVTVQEITDTILLAAVAVPGARLKNVAGRQLDGGVQSVHHGLTALERVLSQRASRDLLARQNAAAPWAGSPYIGAAEVTVSS
jgi:alkylhydroperoxidase/carboxymuconolactone decarboxylase family protein YurZ